LKPAYLFCIGWLFVAWPGACGAAGVPEGSEAQYYLNSAAEHQTVPVRRVRIKAGPVERVAGRRYQWWEMILEKPGPEAVNVEPGPRVFGIRVLSERVPMTGPGGVGDVVRYIYRPPDGGPLEYVNALTGRAALSHRLTSRTRACCACGKTSASAGTWMRVRTATLPSRRSSAKGDR
jgi:hypothetical protein